MNDALRETVTSIERELEQELGASASRQLRALLVRLNETEVVEGTRSHGHARATERL